MDERVPVTVLTGPIGSGKTTLVNRILATHDPGRVAVIENEWGETAVGQPGVMTTEAEVVELRGGPGRGDLIRLLPRLVRRQGGIERVVIETAEAEDPEAIVRTLLVDEELRERLAVDAVVAFTDGVEMADVVVGRGAAPTVALEGILGARRRDTGAFVVPGGLAVASGDGLEPMPSLLGSSTLPDWITAVAWRADGGMLAAACADGSVHEILPSGTATAPVAHHEGGAFSVAYALDGTLASSGADGRVAIGPLPPQVVGAGWIEQVCWSPDGVLLATSVGRRVQLWTKDGSLAVETAPLPAGVECLAWSPEGARLAVGGAGGVTLLGRDGEPVDERLPCEGVVLTMAWGPDRRRLACGTLDRTVCLWDVETRRSETLDGFRRKVRELAWSANGRWLATGGGATPVAYSFLDGEDDIEADIATRLTGHKRAVVWTAFQPAGPRLATVAEDGLLLVWYLPAESPASVTALGTEIGAAAWSPDGRRIAVGGANGTVAVFELT